MSAIALDPPLVRAAARDTTWPHSVNDCVMVSLPKIQDPRAFFEEMKFLVHVQKLEGRAAAITFGFRRMDVRIVELARQPFARRGFETALLLHLDADFAAA